MSSVDAFLSKVDPFRGIPAANLTQLAQSSRELRHTKGETIFSEGQDAANVWVLREGRVQVFKYTSDGTPRAIEIIQPGELFGTLCRLGGKGRIYPCTAVSMDDTVSIEIPEQVFLDYFGRFPSVVTGVCALCSQRLNALQELSCSSQDPVEKRIVRTLFQLSRTHGRILPYTKRQIGELAGTTVETTIRTLSAFQKKSWIASSRGQIELVDEAKLRALLG